MLGVGLEGKGGCALAYDQLYLRGDGSREIRGLFVLSLDKLKCLTDCPQYRNPIAGACVPALAPLLRKKPVNVEHPDLSNNNRTRVTVLASSYFSFCAE